jgi:glucose-1-phosphate thymidylyltransferase
MKLIIPMAGTERRLKPHTHTTPKAMLHLAGKPLLAHLLDSVSSLNMEQVVFIVDKDNPELRNFISTKYSFQATYIQQKELKGVGHAIYGAKKHFKDEEVLILFADTLIEADLSVLKKNKADGIVWTQQVEDPRKFGVVFLHQGYISRLIEKPETPVSDLAIVGLYYFRNSSELFSSLEHLIKNDIKTKGEYQLTDAIQLMINKHVKLVSKQVTTWKDCGTPENLLEANKYLLEKKKAKFAVPKNTVVISPVYIGEGARITNSVIGPNVSIGSKAEIRESIIKDSIINKEASIIDANLQGCIVGEKTKVRGSAKKLNVGDFSEIHYS